MSDITDVMIKLEKEDSNAAHDIKNDMNWQWLDIELGLKRKSTRKVFREMYHNLALANYIKDENFAEGYDRLQYAIDRAYNQLKSIRVIE